MLLRAGALPAKMSIVEERTVGPGLGADSVQAGKTATLVATGLVIVYMLLSYGIFGVFASIVTKGDKVTEIRVTGGARKKQGK